MRTDNKSGLPLSTDNGYCFSVSLLVYGCCFSVSLSWYMVVVSVCLYAGIWLLFQCVSKLVYGCCFSVPLALWRLQLSAMLCPVPSWSPT